MAASRGSLRARSLSGSSPTGRDARFAFCATRRDSERACLCVCAERGLQAPLGALAPIGPGRLGLGIRRSSSGVRGLEGSVFSWRFGAPRLVSVLFAGLLPVGFFSLTHSLFFRLLFSPLPPPSFYPSASSLDLFVSSLARSISGARGSFVFARESFRRLVGRSARPARREPFAVGAIVALRRRKRGAARRGGMASVPPPGRPTRGFDKRASRAMIRPPLLRCLRKAQAFGRRWG